MGGAVGKVAEALGKPLMPWQQHVADVALEQDPITGRLVYREVILTVPRQSGKTTLLLALLIHRMIAMDRPQVAAFTMQTGLQARMRLRREWHERDLKHSPALRDSYVPSWPTGAEALLFHNGSRLEVVAGTESSGHGSTLDLAVIDEAFDQEDDRLEQALRPATITRPNAQLWWVSTAGKPSNMWFRNKIEGARLVADGSAGLAVFEWSAEDSADAGDVRVWRECMPALGIIRPDGSGTSEDDIAEEYRAMTRGGNEDGFRRAYLNQWVSDVASSVVDAAAWAAQHDPDSAVVGPVSLSLEVAQDRSWACIGAAGLRDDGAVHVQVAENHPGTDWVVDKVVELAGERDGRVAVSPNAPAGSLVDALKARGVTVVPIATSEYAQACGAFYDSVTQRRIFHLDQPELNASIQGARKRVTADAWVFDRRRPDFDISPLAAVTLAAWLASIEQPSVYEDRGVRFL